MKINNKYYSHTSHRGCDRRAQSISEGEREGQHLTCSRVSLGFHPLFSTFLDSWSGAVPRCPSRFSSRSVIPRLRSSSRHSVRTAKRRLRRVRSGETESKETLVTVRATSSRWDTGPHHLTLIIHVMWLVPGSSHSFPFTSLRSLR